MRPKLFAVLALLAVLAAVPAGAEAARFKVGMSENNPQMFADPNFQRLGADITRIVVAYDTVEAAARGDDELATRIAPYLAAAEAAGIEPLVTFEHARGAAELCQRNRRLRQCRLPSAGAYERALRAFLGLFPSVRVIAPWNEANHSTQPTARNPKAAARFTRIAERVCRELARNCSIVALDLLDQADNVKAKRPKFRKLSRWVKRFKTAYKGRLNVCGLHTYSDVNRFRSSGTKAMMKALKCKRYWLTESGGLFDFGSFWGNTNRKRYRCKSAPACQLKATKFLFRLVKRTKRIERVYVHSYYGSHAPRFDAGIVTGRPGARTKPRRAYSEVRKYT